jgi:Vitamin B12 dependent methionine synthase, activation domain
VSLTRALQVLTDLPLAIDPDEVLRFQGYKKGRDVATPDVRALLGDALQEGRRLMAPRAVARWIPVARTGAHALEVAGETLAIPRIGVLWGPVTDVAAVVCTIGDALERRVAKLWEARELPLASMLDSVGSGAVESLAEHVNDLLCEQGLPDLRVTNRISPGYADWDVAEQPKLFRLGPADAIGVTLNAACVMMPGKSISLLVGAGPQARVDHYFTQCARCWMRDCAYRRAPARVTVHR